jgi:hypothetical protein
MPLSPQEVKQRRAIMQGAALTRHTANIDEMLLAGGLSLVYHATGMDEIVKLRIVEIYTPLGWRVSVTEGANVTHIEFTER